MIRRSSRESADRASDASSAAGGAATGAAEPAGRHLGGPRYHRGLKVAAIVMASVVAATIAFVAVQVLRLQQNVETMPLNLGEGQESALPVDSSRDPLQILILGSDTRTGNTGEFLGSEEDSSGEGNSDVMMLLTLSADRENVTVVSFPRDLLVPLPACVDPETGELSEAVELGQLNAALGEGGPGCTVAAINDLTGLSVDHFMMAGFNAVSELSSAVGGVEVCVQEPVDDEFSGLELPAGTSEVEGDQALAFLRTRHSFGDGGDIGRIAAQQSFMASLARKVRAEGTLTNLPKLYSIAEVITRNLTVDEGLSKPVEILRIADRLKNVDLGNMAFVTVPVQPWDQDPNRLVLDEEAAAPLFDALRADRGLTEDAPAPSASASEPTDASDAPSPPEETETPAPAPASVPIVVVNATTDEDRAAEVEQLLLEAGYAQTSTFESTPADATLVVFGPGYAAAAAELADRFGVAASNILPDAGLVGIQLQVGADLRSRDTVAASPLGPALEGQTADQVTCQASSGL
ncbi:LytR family transcriptional regulator [Arthrobacter agilis]|uniref:LCP family protein n=1 Tax=Arthrobacter agilis TaxID=37921 RepID=UPI000B34DEF7|nr:LCP family protein [Arthrobacter agilis]OUM45205.1 LytR family transcriptional regulator [Arthrobacter agilis]PPB47532.1 LytR family transcriptional regulator [Arthrobacter agilis]TPV21692.1 LytR family transcriptional regulator [Arthrobacter agilis]VDR32138.1 Biofilm regulatory protein A precursor [Arthrobacter agilis]